MKPWRRPDVIGPGDYAVWYGPAGPAAGCAVEVEGSTVREYQLITDCLEGHIGPPFLCIEVYLDQYPRNIRLRAALGVQQINEYGGEESFVEELPQ